MTDHWGVTRPWSDLRVAIGVDRATFGVADALLERGAWVNALVDEAGPDMSEEAGLLKVLGAYVNPTSSVEAEELMAGCDMLVPASAWGLDHPLVQAAQARGLAIFSDVEVAWRLRHEQRARHRDVPWLVVTGDDHVDVTVTMTQAMLAQGGVQAAGLSFGRRPVIEAVMDEAAHDCWVVGISPAQLRWATSIRAYSAVVLNCGGAGQWYDTAADPPHLHAADLAKVYHQVTHACVYNEEDPATLRMVEEADVVEGARAIGFTTGVPAVSMMGVVDGILVDRAFIPQRWDSAQELAAVDDVPGGAALVGPALAAAGLARSFGVPARAVRDGLVTLGSARVGSDGLDDGEPQVERPSKTATGGPDDSRV